MHLVKKKALSKLQIFDKGKSKVRFPFTLNFSGKHCQFYNSLNYFFNTLHFIFSVKDKAGLYFGF